MHYEHAHSGLSLARSWRKKDHPPKEIRMDSAHRRRAKADVVARAHPLCLRAVLGGNFAWSAFARVGLSISSPPQLGQRSSRLSAHSAQKVHSKLQMNAPGASAARPVPQRSQSGRISSIVSNSHPVHPELVEGLYFFFEVRKEESAMLRQAQHERIFLLNRRAHGFADGVDHLFHLGAVIAFGHDADDGFGA